MTDSLIRILILCEVHVNTKLLQGIRCGFCGNLIIKQQGTNKVFKESDSNVLVYRVDIGYVYVIGSQQKCQVSFISLLRHIEAQYSLAIFKGEAKIILQLFSEEISKLNHIGGSGRHSDIHLNAVFVILTKAETGFCQYSACVIHINAGNKLTGHCHSVHGSVSVYHFDKLTGSKSTTQYSADQRLQRNLGSVAIIIDERVIVKSYVGIINECSCKTLHRGCHLRRIEGSHLHNDSVSVSILYQSKLDLAIRGTVKLGNKVKILLFGNINLYSYNNCVTTDNVVDAFELINATAYLNAVNVVIVTNVIFFGLRQLNRKIVNIYDCIISALDLYRKFLSGVSYNYRILLKSLCKIVYVLLYPSVKLGKIVACFVISLGVLFVTIGINKYLVSLSYNSLDVLRHKNVACIEGLGNNNARNLYRKGYLIRSVHCDCRRGQLHGVYSYRGNLTRHLQSSDQLIKIATIYINNSVRSLQIRLKLSHSAFKLTDLVDVACIIAHAARDLLEQFLLLNDNAEVLAHSIDLRNESITVLIIIRQALRSVISH